MAPVRGTHDDEAGGSGTATVTEAQPISQVPPVTIPPPTPSTDPAIRQTLQTLTQVLVALQQSSQRSDQILQHHDQTLQQIQAHQAFQARQLELQMAEQARRHDEQMEF